MTTNSQRLRTAEMVRSEVFAIRFRRQQEEHRRDRLGHACANYYVRGWLAAALTAGWITAAEREQAAKALDGRLLWGKTWWNTAQGIHIDESAGLS